MSKYKISKALGQIDDSYIKEVLEYTERSRRIGVNKRSMAAIAVAAVMIMALAVTGFSAKIAGKYDMSIPLKPFDVDSRYDRVLGDTQGTICIPADEVDNIALWHGSILRFSENGEKMHFKAGETVKFRMEIDIDAVNAAGYFFSFGRYVKYGDHFKEYETFREGSEYETADNVIEYTYTFSTDADCEFCIRIYDRIIYIKSVSIEKIPA